MVSSNGKQKSRCEGTGMGPTTATKRCSVCGTDVSQQKRTKDTNGRYYCQPCYSTKIGERRMDSPAVQSSINIDPNPVNPAAEPADRLPVSRVLLAKAIHPRVGVVFILLVLASIGVVESIQSRDAEGLPAASIFWGVVATIGIVLGVGV